MKATKKTRTDSTTGRTAKHTRADDPRALEVLRYVDLVLSDPEYSTEQIDDALREGFVGEVCFEDWPLTGIRSHMVSLVENCIDADLDWLAGEATFKREIHEDLDIEERTGVKPQRLIDLEERWERERAERLAHEEADRAARNASAKDELAADPLGFASTLKRLIDLDRHRPDLFKAIAAMLAGIDTSASAETEVQS